MERITPRLPAALPAVPGTRVPAVTGDPVDSVVKLTPDDTLQQGQVAALAAQQAEPGPDVDRAAVGIPQMHAMGFTGKGAVVAVIDTGIMKVPDLEGKVIGWQDMDAPGTDQSDPMGHGTEIAGEIAGSGKASNGKVVGAAPDARLVGVRMANAQQAIDGLKWVIANKDRYNIRIVNLSLGAPPQGDPDHDPWAQACEEAIKAGLIVVCAAGNEGPDQGTVSSPGFDPRVITVGALDDQKTADPSDDRMAEFSSRGPGKPDILAPGVHVWGTLAPGSVLDVKELPHYLKDYIALSGTSMATALVTGVIAAMLEAKPDLTHDEAKTILQQTSRKLEGQTGPGALDAVAAVREAARRAGKTLPDAPPRQTVVKTQGLGGRGHFDLGTLTDQPVRAPRAMAWHHDDLVFDLNPEHWNIR